jgi:hypothetical protein
MLKMADFGPRAKFESSWKIFEISAEFKTTRLYSPYRQQQMVDTIELILSLSHWILKVKNRFFPKIYR